jgi:hypothetical protein
MARFALPAGVVLTSLSVCSCLPEENYTDHYEPDAAAEAVKEGDESAKDPPEKPGASNEGDTSDVSAEASPSANEETTVDGPPATVSNQATSPADTSPADTSPALPTSENSPETDAASATEDSEFEQTDEPVTSSADEVGAGGMGPGSTLPEESDTSGQGEGGQSSEPTVPDEPGDYFGASRCSDDFVFCEDFESGELDFDVWEPQGPAPEIEDGIAARGERSAHFHTEDNGLSLIRTSVPFPMANNTYYARAFIYFDAMPTAPPWAHWTVSGARGSGTDAEIRVGGQYDNNINRFGVGTDGGPTGDWTNLDNDPDGEPRAVPTGEWVCLEWQNDGSDQEGRFWWDGTEHESLFTSATQHGGSDDDYLLPEFESAWFGWWLYQEGTTPSEFDVWIDEIVIDDEPIGCTR